MRREFPRTPNGAGSAGSALPGLPQPGSGTRGDAGPAWGAATNCASRG